MTGIATHVNGLESLVSEAEDVGMITATEAYAMTEDLEDLRARLEAAYGTGGDE